MRTRSGGSAATEHRGYKKRGVEQNGASQKRLYTGGSLLREDATKAGRPGSGAKNEIGFHWLRSGPELRPSGVDTSRRLLGATPAPRNYQTNPPFFDGFSDGSGYEYIGYTRNTRAKAVGSFWKTNPPVRLREGYPPSRGRYGATSWRDSLLYATRKKHAILRNEPTVLAGDILCIMRMVN